MIDYEHIRELAEKAESARAYVQALGQMNAPTGYEERIKSDAQYRLAKDAADAADRAYRDVMDRLTPDQLNELVHSHNQNST